MHQKFTSGLGAAGPPRSEVSLVARVDLFAKIPLIGMSMVFLAMFIVAVTAYLHIGWWSIIGYAIAAVLMVAGFAMTFRDINDTDKPPPVVRKSEPTNGAAQ
jgi:hypothetical protein